MDGGAYKHTNLSRRGSHHATHGTILDHPRRQHSRLVVMPHGPEPKVLVRTRNGPTKPTSASPGSRHLLVAHPHTQRAAHRKDGGGKGALPAARRLRALCSPAVRQSRAISRIGSRGSRGHAVRECHSRARGRGPRHGDGMGRKEWVGAIGAAAPASEPSTSAAGKILDRRARATARLTSVGQPQAALPVGHLAHGCNVLLDELTDVPWQVQLQCRRVLSHHQTLIRPVNEEAKSEMMGARKAPGR